MMLGQVASGAPTTKLMVVQSLAAGRSLRESYTHQEGGNTLVGTRADGSAYALVGLDSFEFSRSVLHMDLGRVPADDEVKRYLAADLGIPPDRVDDVILVEQPGEFHLDMRIALMGPGEVVVDAPKAAARLAQKWIAETVRASKDNPMDLDRDILLMLELAEKKQIFIDSIVRQLSDPAHRLSVKAIPMVFEGPLIGKMNFVNGEGGTDPAGNRFFITNGGIAQAQDFIRRQFRDAFAVDVDFVDRQASMQSLARDGGIGCRTVMDVGANKVFKSVRDWVSADDPELAVRKSGDGNDRPAGVLSTY